MPGALCDFHMPYPKIEFTPSCILLRFFSPAKRGTGPAAEQCSRLRRRPVYNQSVLIDAVFSVGGCCSANPYRTTFTTVTHVNRHQHRFKSIRLDLIVK